MSPARLTSPKPTTVRHGDQPGAASGSVTSGSVTNHPFLSSCRASPARLSDVPRGHGGLAMQCAHAHQNRNGISTVTAVPPPGGVLAVVLESPGRAVMQTAGADA